MEGRGSMKEKFVRNISINGDGRIEGPFAIVGYFFIKIDSIYSNHSILQLVVKIYNIKKKHVFKQILFVYTSIVTALTPKLEKKREFP